MRRIIVCPMHCIAALDIR